MEGFSCQIGIMSLIRNNSNDGRITSKERTIGDFISQKTAEIYERIQDESDNCFYNTDEIIEIVKENVNILINNINRSSKSGYFIWLDDIKVLDLDNKENYSKAYNSILDNFSKQCEETYGFVPDNIYIISFEYLLINKTKPLHIIYKPNG